MQLPVIMVSCCINHSGSQQKSNPTRNIPKSRNKFAISFQINLVPACCPQGQLEFLIRSGVICRTNASAMRRRGPRLRTNYDEEARQLSLPSQYLNLVLCSQSYIQAFCMMNSVKQKQILSSLNAEWVRTLRSQNSLFQVVNIGHQHQRRCFPARPPTTTTVGVQNHTFVTNRRNIRIPSQLGQAGIKELDLFSHLSSEPIPNLSFFAKEEGLTHRKTFNETTKIVRIR